MREVIARAVERLLARLRNEPDVDWFVAQGMQLGVGTHISHPLYIDRTRPWLITIGDHATVAPYVAIITHDASLNQYTAQARIAPVIIGPRVNVGVGAILLPGTVIGADSVIGAGAVVRGEIPPGSLVTGNPAKVTPMKAIVAWHRRSAASAPSWPREGWMLDTGITDERRRAQREALADGASGYVPARAAPDSPYALREQRP